MFYYIQNEKIISISIKKIQHGKDIKQIEDKNNFDNPIYEGGKIIEYKNSKKETNDLQIIQDKKNNEILVNLEEKKKELEGLGYLVEIKDYKIITTNTEKSILYENNFKINQIKWKYRNIIFEKYSLTDQLNMGHEASNIAIKSQIEKRDFTSIEIKRLQEIESTKIWIDEQKELCRQEILEFNN